MLAWLDVRSSPPSPCTLPNFPRYLCSQHYGMTDRQVCMSIARYGTLRSMLKGIKMQLLLDNRQSVMVLYASLQCLPSWCSSHLRCVLVCLLPGYLFFHHELQLHLLVLLKLIMTQAAYNSQSQWKQEWQTWRSRVGQRGCPRGSHWPAA